MKKIPLSDYFQIIKPEYVYLKLTPTNAIRNYDSKKISSAIASLHKNLLQRIRKHNKQYFFEAPSKVAYYIYMEKGKAEFYFIVAEAHLCLIKEKIGDTWKGITIQEVHSLPTFGENAIRYQLSYKKEDALSLAVDKRTNVLLSSVLNVMDIVEEGDKIGLFYNFIPTEQKSWRAEYDQTLESLEEGMPVDRNKLSPTYLLTLTIWFLLEIVDMATEVLGEMLGDSKRKEKKPLRKRELSPATLKKKESRIIRTQILAMAESKSELNAINYAQSLCEAFGAITGDNELVYRKHKGKINFNALSLAKAPQLKISAEECHNFLALPSRELLQEHKVIERVDTFENQVPAELRKGIMCIGKNTYRGNVQKAYLTNDKEYRNLALTIIGPTRAGKSTLISNLAKDAIDGKECTILFDFCGNNELSDEVADVFPKSKVLSIDCQDHRYMQGLGYNEVKAGGSVFENYRNAKIQTMQLLTLINSVNASDKELSAKMDRFLESAALVVFINHGAIKDVFGCLTNHQVRQKWIRMIPPQQKENLEEYVFSLQELDDTKDGEVIGTRLNSISGIIDRINRLKQNTYLELMLKKDCSKNIDLVEEIQKNQLICLRMPEVMFATESEKDTYCTYWITKIWLALQLRKWREKDKLTKVNIVVDELYQVPRTQDFIRSKLSQMAKFQGKMIISCHYLGQIGIIRNELKAANASYMLIAGCNKDNFNELKDELAPYTVEDLLNLKRYHSLNLVKTNHGFATFITKLPKPVKV